MLNLVGAIVELNLNCELSFAVIDCLRNRGIPFIVCSGYADLPEVKGQLGDLPLMPKLWNHEALDALIDQTFTRQTAALRRG